MESRSYSAKDRKELGRKAVKKSMGKELETLQGQTTQFLEVQSRLAEAEAEVVRPKAQEGELKKIKKQLAEIEDYKAQLVQKWKRWRSYKQRVYRHHKNWRQRREVVLVRGDTEVLDVNGY